MALPTLDAFTTTYFLEFNGVYGGSGRQYVRAAAELEGAGYRRGKDKLWRKESVMTVEEAVVTV